MSKKEKLKQRLAGNSSDFTYQELRTLLVSMGYTEDHKGKPSGSRVSFVHLINQHVIILHKPHPGNILKRYQVIQLIDELKKEGLL